MSSDNAENKNGIDRLMGNKNPTGWGHLPTEMKEIVVGHMDLETTLNFRQCDFASAQLVKKVSKQHDVHLKVENSNVSTRMTIELAEFGSKPEMYWEVRSKGSDGSEVEQKDRLLNTISFNEFADRKYWITTFLTVGRLLTLPMFNVKKLELRLLNFNETIKFGRRFKSIDQINLTHCWNILPIKSLYRCFSQPPNQTNVTGFHFQKKFFRSIYHGKECLFELNKILDPTDYPFNGNKKFRDEGGYLTAKGFDQFFKILLNNTLPYNGLSRRFIIHKGFMDQLEVLGKGMIKHIDLRENMSSAFTMDNSISWIIVSFKDSYTVGVMCRKN